VVISVATFIPPLNSIKAKMTRGEARFASRLHTNLDEDFYCWFDIAVGTKRSRYPDFMILNAELGLLSVEVKDWKLSTIQSIDKYSASLMVNGAIKKTPNPMEQSRQCTYAIVQRLERDPDLLRHAGRFEGKLSFPYGFGVAFPNITAEQASAIDGWEDLFPAHRVIYQDQMTESVDSDDFRTRIEDFFDVRFGSPLTEAMIDRVRWHLFPEIRIASEKDLFAEDIALDDGTVELSKIKQFDIEQEKFARQLGDGHRVIRGVAGSGKTQIIAYRCEYLVAASSKPILILYFNITAKALLKKTLAARGVLDRVDVCHIHQWCYDQVRASGAGRDPIEQFALALAAGTVDTGRYSAVMIDEGQDFEQDWIRTIADFCAVENLPLLFVYDDAQSIYEKHTGLGFTLASAGIRAQGRTTVMKVNYRNTHYIQQLASGFLHGALQRGETDETPLPAAPREEWLHPVSVGDIGTAPAIVVCDGPRGEGEKIVRWLRGLHVDRNVPWGDICLILRTKAEAGQVADILTRHGIPAYDLSASRESKETLDLSDPTVKITTVHSSKGLEFPCILIPHLCGFADSGERAVEDARLLYVAMTRSTRTLVLTARHRTALVDRMEGVVAEIAASMEPDAASMAALPF